MITLINVIEINPLLYTKDDFELPESSDYPDPEEWRFKWEETASKLNFNFKIIGKGSSMADIETMDDENLHMIIEARLEDMEDDPDEGCFVLAFDGGIALEKDNKIYIRPMCCSDMSDLKNWQNILTNSSAEWKTLWIGHPWVLYRKENGKISFSEYTESNEIDPENIKILVEVDESELRAEFEKVLQRQTDFKNRVLNILKKINAENPERMAELLTGMG